MRKARGCYASCANPVQMAAMEMTPLDKTITQMAEEVSGRSTVVLSAATMWQEPAARLRSDVTVAAVLFGFFCHC